jgi:cytochrome c-type biogenesis protein CcmH
MRKPFRKVPLRLAPYLLLGLLLLIPAIGSGDSDRAKEVGSKLMCICGCGQVLTECNHIHCPSSVPMRGEVNDKLAAGMTDDQVLTAFVSKYGAKVLAAPRWNGLFNKTAWATPFIALLAGLAGLMFYLRRIKSTTAPPAPSAIEPSRYDQKIEDELNKFTPED